MRTNANQSAVDGSSKRIVIRKDLREFQRAQLSEEISYRLVRDSLNRALASSPKKGRTVDASAGGLRILTGEPIKENFIIEVTLDLFKSNDPHSYRTKVVRSAFSKESGFFESGLRFSDLPPVEQEDLNQRVEQALSFPFHAPKNLFAQWLTSIQSFFARSQL